MGEGFREIQARMMAVPRPSFAKGIKEAVTRKDTPMRGRRPICFFCGDPIKEKELQIHHEHPWTEIKFIAAHDLDMIESLPETQALAWKDLYNQLENLHCTHKQCNNDDSKLHADWRGYVNHTQRMRDEEERGCP